MKHVDIESLISAEPVKGAWLSDDRLYRYLAWRIWNPRLPLLRVCMLNPSTADARKDDPTLRRLIAFAKSWGYGGLLVVNLFAFRTAYPAEMRGRAYDDIVGPENNAALEAAILRDVPILLGWGAAVWRGLAGETTRRDDVLRFVRYVRAWPMCLGITASAEPRHPLYVRGDQRMEPFAMIPVDA